jgi:twitching motility protein PilU
MSQENSAQSYKYMVDLLRLMVTKKASDLFIANDFPPSMKIDGKMTAVANQKLTGAYTKSSLKKPKNATLRFILIALGAFA